MHWTRTNRSQGSVVASSATTFFVCTDDPSLSVVMVPMPTLMLDFGGKPGLRPAAMRAAFPQRPPPQRPPEPAPTASIAAEAPSPEPSPDDISAQEAPPEPPPADDQAEASPPEVTDETSSESEDGATAHPHRIEMTIDSLPFHSLTEPIPIVIDPLGETIFTASMRNLDISATGNSIGEALVLLKEQIEFVYGDLNRRSNRTTEQKATLQMLATYIARQSTKPEWL
jgi:hypothetical protein